MSTSTDNEDQIRKRTEPPKNASKRSTKASTSFNAGKIILLSGPIGAGKSTVAQAYTAFSTVPTVYIEGDTFWKHIVNPGSIQKPRNIISRIVMKSMVLAAIPYARGGFETIVDFTIGPWALPFFKPWMKNIPVDFIILCPSERVCEERANGREGGARHDKELFDAFNEMGELFERFTLRDDEGSVEEIIEKMKERMQRGEYRLDFSTIPDNEG